jgi:hypothetical protein
MRHMMEWMIENKPEAAEKYIETLCAIKWRQYLTRSEAMEIFENMVPSGAWNYDAWLGAMKNLGLEYEREGVFNCYALWVVMNAIHSDNGKVNRPYGLAAERHRQPRLHQDRPQSRHEQAA